MIRKLFLQKLEEDMKFQLLTSSRFLKTKFDTWETHSKINLILIEFNEIREITHEIHKKHKYKCLFQSSKNVLPQGLCNQITKIKWSHKQITKCKENAIALYYINTHDNNCKWFRWKISPFSQSCFIIQFVLTKSWVPRWNAIDAF